MYYKINLGSYPEVNFIGRVKYPEPWKHFERLATEYILFVVLSGELYIEEAQKKYHIKENEYLILEQGKAHKGYKNATCDYAYIHFTHQDITPVKDEKQIEAVIIQEPTMEFHDPKPQSDFNIYVAKHGKITDSYFHHQIKTQLDLTISDYYTSGSNHPVLSSATTMNVLLILNRILVEDLKRAKSTQFSKGYVTAQELKRYIEENTYHVLTSDMIVEKFDLNYDYLNRLMNEYFDISIRQYIQSTKIEVAKKIMVNNDIKMCDIGTLIGIDDQFYFSRLFKKHVGISPTAYYKKMHMNGSKKD